MDASCPQIKVLLDFPVGYSLVKIGQVVEKITVFLPGWNIEVKWAVSDKSQLGFWLLFY